MRAMTRPQKLTSWGGRFDRETLILSDSCVTCLKKVPHRELLAGTAAGISGPRSDLSNLVRAVRLSVKSQEAVS